MTRPSRLGWVVSEPRRLDPHPFGHLLATCWCEEKTVYVPTADVFAGLTRTCGADACRPEDS